MAAPGALARHEGIVIDDDSTASELDLLEPFGRPIPAQGVKRRRPPSEEDADREAEPQEAGPHDAKQEDVTAKVEWTDDSDGEYERLKKRKRGSSGRGRGGAAGWEKKSTDVKGKGRATASTAAAGSSSSRGRGGRGRGSRRSMANDTDRIGPNAHRYDGNDENSDDDDDVDIPDYLKKRRREFDEKRAILKDAGLRLPPDYTDIYFSDDDNDRRRRHRVPARSAFSAISGSSSSGQTAKSKAEPQPLQERPQFDSSVRPSRERKDIVLEYSAGVIPACMAQYLRDYQVAGVQFLHRLFVYQRGGILGDDMGLGKTVQVAAFLTAAFGKTGDERDDKRMRKMRRAEPLSSSADGDARWYPVVLVVCPGSLIQNWRNELQRWGWWHVDLYHGAGKDDVLQAARAGRLEIMVTTYATYKNHRGRINAVRWDAVVADECHVLKERTSETTKAMNEVNALCRIGLTGTAIQNRYEELWTLLNWTNPGRFGTLAEWRHTISRPLTIGQSHDATLYQLSLARRTAKKLVQNLLPDFFLRRMKSLIAHQLPRKTDRVVFCPLTELQSQAYENFVDSEQVEFLRTVSADCDCGSGGKRGWCCYRTLPGTDTTWFSLVFPTIQSLLKLANHLTLLIPSADAVIGTGNNNNNNNNNNNIPDARPNAAANAAAERHRRAMDVLKICVPDDWAALYRHRDSMVNLANPDFCGKWKVLRKLLRFWHESGDKVLVFSHNVRLLRILQHLFHNTSYSVSYLDGSLGYDERQRVVDDFNADPAQFVFLISTKAGGVGLNITSANKVVIFDPHWNPAYDLQAQDRAYRIGQVRDVDVFRLVSAGTIEEIVYARQIYKQQQANIGYSASTERRYFRGVQEDSARQGEIFGLNNLFTFHTDQVVLRDIVNKTNIAEAKAGVHLTTIDMARAAADRENEVLVKMEGPAGGAGELATLLDPASRGEDSDGNGNGSDNAAAAAPAGKPKSDAIQAILASAGVEYTHDNSEVVGSSRVEAQLSRRAELVLAEGDEGGEADLDRGSTASDSDGGSDAADRSGITANRNTAELSMLLADTSAAFVSAVGGGGGGGDASGLHGSHARPGGLVYADDGTPLGRLLYNPPDDVMRRQFCTMAREAGFAAATDFALVVEGWTPEQRRQCLEGFYRRREARVREQLEEARETEGEEEEEKEQEKQETAPDEVAALVIGDNVVERRVLIVKREETGDDKREQKEKKEKNEKYDDNDKKTPFSSRSKKEEKEEETKDAKSEPRLPRIKNEDEGRPIRPITPVQVKKEEAKTVRVKREEGEEDDGRVVVLLSSSPLAAPVKREPPPAVQEEALPSLSPPPPATNQVVLDDSDETDEL